MARREFVRLAHVDEHAGPGLQSFGEFVMRDLARVAPERLEKKSEKIIAGSSVQACALLAFASANWSKAPSAWLAYIADGPAPM